jgi:hypothetical protein
LTGWTVTEGERCYGGLPTQPGLLDEAVVESMAACGARASETAAANAFIDEGADARIQAALRGDDLAATTLLVIAHRLATIADFDKVAVLARGALVECDAPGALLGDPGSAFYDLCAATGDLAGLVARAGGAAVR